MHSETGVVQVVCVSEEETVVGLVARCAEAFGARRETAEVVFDGEVMDADKDLSEYAVEAGSRVVLRCIELASTKWRISCRTTSSGWAWDVYHLSWDTDVTPLRIIESGNAGPHYTGVAGRLWGGRKRDGVFFYGHEWEKAVAPRAVTLKQHGRAHFASKLTVERCVAGEWEAVKTYSGLCTENTLQEQVLAIVDAKDSGLPAIRGVRSGVAPVSGRKKKFCVVC